IYGHGKEVISGATFTIVEKLKPTISETKQVIGHAAQKCKEVITHPIYYVQKATSFFWENFPPLSWFTYGVIALNAIPLTILLTFLFVTTSIVMLITGTGIFLAKGFFTDYNTTSPSFILSKTSRVLIGSKEGGIGGDG
ncbi:2380_t:CDS:2, partial [Entrophospora sp. SA101]